MLGLYSYDKGEILVDGKEIYTYNLNSFRNCIGYVPQDPQLFSLSIRENLLWAAPESNEANIWEACRIANAEKFIKELPNGLDTQLGDRGTRLSGGQKQRLALARALIRKPELLILDEATSSLDSESESLIRKSIDSISGTMTIVLIAHRLSTIRNSDYIYVVEDGNIIESGTYHQLSNNLNSKLSFMIKSQTF